MASEPVGPVGPHASRVPNTGALHSFAVVLGLAAQLGLLVSWGTRVDERTRLLETERTKQEARLERIEDRLSRNTVLLTGIDERLSTIDRRGTSALDELRRDSGSARRE